MSAVDPSRQSSAVRLRLLIETIGPVAREPGYGKGYAASGEVRDQERNERIAVWMPPQDERPMQLRIGFGDSESLIGLGGSSGVLRAWDWKTGEAVPPIAGLTALKAAEQLLAKLDAQRDEWVARVDRAAGERLIPAFFSPWPQSLASALAAFERQLGSTPTRHPIEVDTEDPGLRIWLTVFAEGHLRGMRLVDFVAQTSRDPICIADRFREQPEPPQAAYFRAVREAKLRPDALAAAIDKHLTAVGWRLVMFDVMYGKPMLAELTQRVIADAAAAKLPVRIALGETAFR
jgi:hypothetical protein